MPGTNPPGWGYPGEYFPFVDPSVTVPFIATSTVVYGPALNEDLHLGFIASTTVLYDPGIPKSLDVPFISSSTVLYGLEFNRVVVPFISSTTTIYPIFSIFSDFIGSGAGNGGELFRLDLAPAGGGSIATLSNPISTSASTITLTADSGLPPANGFILTIDTEMIYVGKLGTGLYKVLGRGIGNTVTAAHSAGASAVWNDTYDMAVASTQNADASFESEASVTYPGWLVAFDSTQAYIGTDRYPFRVTELVGVFPAGGGANKLDGSQPNAVSVPGGLSDNCPAALSVPGRIATSLVTGDVAVFRYQNPEAVVLTLGSRAVAAQTWYGLKRVDASNNDVTFTDPNGIVVDGNAQAAWNDPVGRFTTTTLPGADRTFTYGPPYYGDEGWPFGALAVRQGRRRVPYWEAPDWHNFNYVYSGFSNDATYVQVVVNRNGYIPDTHPTIDLPGPQDIDGPNASWDDGSYYFGAAWYVALFNGAYIYTGPTLNGSSTGGGSGGTGGGGGGGTLTFPTTGEPVFTPASPGQEGGNGGNIGIPEDLPTSAVSMYWSCGPLSDTLDGDESGPGP